MCINSVKETCFSQKYQKWIYQVLEINSSIVYMCMCTKLHVMLHHIQLYISNAAFLTAAFIIILFSYHEDLHM